MTLDRSLRNVWLASLMAVLAGGCGAGGREARDAGGLGGGDATMAPGEDAATADAGGPDGADAAAVPVNDAWIYVASNKGVDRVDAAGGTVVPFGVSVDTRSVAVSPSGRLVAQELADQRIAVFDAGGTPLSTFEVRMGLLGWSDEETLLFLDPQTKFLQQTSVDGQRRRYLPLPPGLDAYGYTGATVSPDHSLVVVHAEPFARDNVIGFYLLVLSAVDGTLVRDLGVHMTDGGVWTGDGRLVVRDSAAGGFVALAPRSGDSTPVAGAAALDGDCGFVGWYEAGRILLGKLVVSSDTGRCVPSATYDVDTGDSTPFAGSYQGGSGTSALIAPPFAQSADGREAAVVGQGLEVGAVAGGERRSLGSARGSIVAVSWAHPTGGTTTWPAPQTPPPTVPARAGAPDVAGRSGGMDCRAGRWVNRTPATLPAGWPGPWGGSSVAFDTAHGTLLVEGAYANAASLFLGTLPNLDYETMAWDGAEGQWTNLSRPDGFGPAGGRAMAFDSHRGNVIAMGSDLPGDGPWTWTRTNGWQNLHAATAIGAGPHGLSTALSVYDAGRDRWVLLGGYIPETWEWDGVTWAKSSASPPGGTSTLYGARLVYDDNRGRIYAVGDRNRGASPWLYEPDQSRWTAQPSSGSSPLPRDGAGVAYDARRDRVMVFGGLVLQSGGGSVVGDLAEWDPASGAWQICPSSGAAPSARQNAALVYDPGRDVLVLFGGQTADAGAAATPELWEWYVP